MNKLFFYACYLLDNPRGKVRVRAINSLEMARSFKITPKGQKNSKKVLFVG